MFPFQETDNLIHIHKFNSAIQSTPNSIWAEITAILIALTMVPQQTEVHIVKDSASAIQSILDYISQQIYKKVNKYWHTLTLEAIKEIIGEKNIKVFLYKVEIHSGHRWNEETNRLVRLRIELDTPFDIKWEKLKQIHYYYKWNDHMIDLPIKDTTKLHINTRNIIDLITLCRYDLSLNDDIRKAINLKLTIETLEYIKLTHNKTSNVDMRLRIRMMKLLNNELSTQYIWNQYHPDLYKIVLCPFCQVMKKDNVYIFTCSKKIYTIQSQLRNIVFWKLKQFCSYEKQLWEEIKGLDKEWLRIDEQ